MKKIRQWLSVQFYRLANSVDPLTPPAGEDGVYILRKDLPAVKSGARFVYLPNQKAYAHKGEAAIIMYPSNIIHNSPEWFMPEGAESSTYWWSH